MTLLCNRYRRVIVVTFVSRKGGCLEEQLQLGGCILVRTATLLDAGKLSKDLGGTFYAGLFL